MRQLQITGKARAEWREAPAPRLQADAEALVRPIAVATCDLDTAFLTGLVPIDAPFPLGHEAVAEVAEVGDQVQTVAPGDVVVVPFQISCGHCRPCRAGRTASCRSVPLGSAYGMEPIGGPWGGALADLLRVPYADAMLVKVPTGVEPVAIPSLADNVPDGFRTVRDPLRAAPDSEVLVVGGMARSIGLYSVACAKALRAPRIVYADFDEARLEVAESLGAEVTPVRIAENGDPAWPRKLGRFPIAVDASGSHGGLHAAIRSTTPNAVVTGVSVFFEPETPMPLFEMYSRGCTFRTERVHARSLIPELLELVAGGKLDPALVTSEVMRIRLRQVAGLRCADGSSRLPAIDHGVPGPLRD